jgi:transposase
MEHKAGDKLYVDYTGSKLAITDRESGEIKEVEVFVAVLGASQYTYVEASMSQKQEDFISSVEHALIYFGGVPRAIVPDNLKSAVTKASKYEPFLNQVFEDFSLHYETTILPARPNKPRDKSLVEGGVKIVYNRIFSALRNEVFFSIQELNMRIHELLVLYNQIPFQGRECSRESLFKEIDQPCLKALPVERYILKKYALATVLKSSHVMLSEDKHYYSVHYKYLGEKVKLIYNASTVEIYHKTERIAFHQRHAKPNGYTTIREHMPSKHNFVTDWNPEYFLNWATNTGTATHAVIEQLLNGRQHPEQAYKSCIGILNLAKKFGKERLNNACERALYFQCCNYGSIKNILDKGIDLSPPPTTTQYSIPFHDNIRGQQYYQ